MMAYLSSSCGGAAGGKGEVGTCERGPMGPEGRAGGRGRAGTSAGAKRLVEEVGHVREAEEVVVYEHGPPCRERKVGILVGEGCHKPTSDAGALRGALG